MDICSITSDVDGTTDGILINLKKKKLFHIIQIND